jgi:hypothetical protein
MAKTYKNMSTILEKVKTGKIDNVVKTSKFSNIKYFKKNEIIEPYLHIIDTEILSRNLWHFVSYQMGNNKVFNKIYEKINAKSVNLKGKEINKSTLLDKMKDIYTSFPKEIIYDIFNQFNTNSYKLKYKDRTPGNKNRFKFIDKANDSVLKIITNNSNIRSLVFTENILQYYLSLLVELEMDNPEDFKNLMKDLKKKDDDDDDSDNATNNQDDDKQNDDGNANKTDVSSQPVDNQQDTTNQNGDDSQNNIDSSVPKQNNNQQSSGAGKGSSDQKQTSPDELLNKMLTSTKENEKLFNDVVEQAKESIDFIEKVMSEDEIQKHWDTKNAEKFNPEGLRKVQNILKTIELNSDSLKPYIKKIVDKDIRNDE